MMGAVPVAPAQLGAWGGSCSAGSSAPLYRGGPRVMLTFRTLQGQWSIQPLLQAWCPPALPQSPGPVHISCCSSTLPTHARQEYHSPLQYSWSPGSSGTSCIYTHSSSMMVSAPGTLGPRHSVHIPRFVCPTWPSQPCLKVAWPLRLQGPTT